MTDQEKPTFVWVLDGRSGQCHAVPSDQADGTDDGLYSTACDHVYSEADAVKDLKEFSEADGGLMLCPVCLPHMGQQVVDAARWLV